MSTEIDVFNLGCYGFDRWEEGQQMAAYAHERRQLHRGDLVVVTCDHPCNVRLVGDQDFRLFQDGTEHRYYGGFYQRFPARLVVPNDGVWNVVIDLGGRRETAKYQVQYIEMHNQAVA